MLKRLYCWLHKRVSLPEERGGYSAGVWQHMVRKKVLQWCASLPGPLLEVGCGEGLFLRSLRRSGVSTPAVGVDIRPDVLAQCRHLLAEAGFEQIPLVRADAASLPFGENVFPSIVCINMFFNLPSWDHVVRSMREFGRVCSRGAVLILDIRNRVNLLLRLKYRLARYYDPTAAQLPLRTYSLREMQVLLSSCGFRVDAVEPVGWPHNRLSPVIIIKAVRQ